jgi:hypothetical protein
LTAVAGCGSERSPRPPPAFTRKALDTAFRSECVTAFDVDRDGHLDLVTYQSWYSGPAFTDSHPIVTPKTFDPATQYSDCVAVFGEDVDHDGRTDLIVAPFPTEEMSWFANPEAGGTWTRHLLAPALSAGIETPIFVDLFGDGRRVLLMGKEPELVLGWFEPAKNSDDPWVLHPISDPGFTAAGHFEHGLGAGDVDGDGRLDVLTASGWFQQTAERGRWLSHPFDFGVNDCSSMYALDVNGDGRADVICASPHGYGLRWWEQTAGGFVRHLIDETLSQMHTVLLVDLDGDGTAELVTGKRWYAHGPNGDPGVSDPALLVYYAIRPGPVFERHLIDDDSGIGTGFYAGDADGDGKTDIAVSNKKGLFFFQQR